MNKTKKRRAGFYWLNDKPYISVTNVLKVIEKPALRYWFGREVYYAMAKNPSLDERVALAMPYKTSKSAKERGSTIHSIIEAHKKGAKQIRPKNPELRGYAQAFYRWFNDIKPEIVENERTIVNEEYQYAGTLDLMAKIGGKLTVIDFKTSKKGVVYDESHLQISAYLECTKAENGGIVALAEDGTYNYVVAREAFKPFLSALELYKFINEDKLKSIGY